MEEPSGAVVENLDENFASDFLDVSYIWSSHGWKPFITALETASSLLSLFEC
jgi:hypothetical protein